MSADNPESKIVVFDTTAYAGNFEREMCAFITGQVGECQVGMEVAREIQEDLRHLAWYEHNIVHEADDHGCERPTYIWPTPGRFNNGYGGHYDDTPEVRATLDARSATANFPAYESVAIFVEALPPEDVLAEMVERAKQFCTDNNIGYKGCRLLEPRYETKHMRVVVGHDEVHRG